MEEKEDKKEEKTEERSDENMSMEDSIKLQHQRMAERLVAARHDSGVTLAEITAKTGLAASSVFRFEKGEIKTCKIDNIQKLAEVYGVNAGWLFGLDMPREGETDEHETLRKNIAADLIFIPMDELQKLRWFIDMFLHVDREDI